MITFLFQLTFLHFFDDSKNIVGNFLDYLNEFLYKIWEKIDEYYQVITFLFQLTCFLYLFDNRNTYFGNFMDYIWWNLYK